MSRENVELARRGYEALNAVFSGDEDLERWRMSYSPEKQKPRLSGTFPKRAREDSNL